MPYLTWLADALRDAGLPVREIPGWQTRGHGVMAAYTAGVLCHHTAGAAQGDYPSERVVVHGRAGLAGPLANLGLARDGTWIVVAAGKAWHAGRGSLPWCPSGHGNDRLIGVEAESVGTRDDWTPEQRESYPRGVAALLGYLGLGADRAAGHKEWAPNRKIDPAYWDMDEFRADVHRWLTAPASAQEDDMIIDNIRLAGAGTLRLICPVGAASSMTGRAWISAACDGPDEAALRGWFQDDTDGISDFTWLIAFADGHSARPWAEFPDGSTQINMHYDFPNGGVVCLEAMRR